MQSSQDHARKPRIALAIGDPAGIGAELAARMAADPQVNAAANLIIIGDARVLDRGAREAGLSLDLGREGGDGGRPVLRDLGHLDPDTIELGRATEAGGRRRARRGQGRGRRLLRARRDREHGHRRR